jgi:hypothetical protein
VSNTGGVATGTLNLVNSNTTEFSTASNCGTSLAAGASCMITVTFNASTGGARSGTLTMSASPGGMTSTNLSGTGMYRLTVNRSGNGDVSSTSAGISCGTDCTQLYASGTSVTLQARVTNGSNLYFGGWSSGGCSGIFRDCTVTMNQSRTVGASFADQKHNLVFLTSGTYPATLGKPADYDNECNKAATTAGLNNANGNGFVSVVSASSSSIGSRLDGVQGWILMDGRAFALTRDDLFGGKHIVLNPVTYNENGATLGNVLAMTGTSAGGVATENTCSHWSTTSGTYSAGRGLGGPYSWVEAETVSCASQQRLICMGVAHDNQLVPTTTSGRRIFRTAVPYFVASDPPDKFCEAQKPQGMGEVKAMVAYTSAAAAEALKPSTPYVRIDGQYVGTGSEIALGTDLPTGIWQAGSGAYVASGGANAPVWIGQSNLTDKATAATNCSDWASQSGSGHSGLMMTASKLFANAGTVGCAFRTNFLYCVEQ